MALGSRIGFTENKRPVFVCICEIACLLLQMNRLLKYMCHHFYFCVQKEAAVGGLKAAHADKLWVCSEVRTVSFAAYVLAHI